MEIIPKDHTVPDVANLMAGNSSSSVSYLQVLNDGNVYAIEETGGTPGFDLHMIVHNVIRFFAFAYKAYYDPGTHYIEIQLYNFLTGQWDTFTTIENHQGMDYRYIDIVDDAPYIKDNKVEIAFDHILGGNASHRMFIDYVALVR